MIQAGKERKTQMVSKSLERKQVVEAPLNSLYQHSLKLRANGLTVPIRS